MGTWSPDILGGDGPMDTLGGIGTMIGYDDDKKGLYPLEFNASETRKVRSLLEAHESKILAGKFVWRKKKQVPWDNEDWPVIAAVYLSTGATMPDEIKTGALDACRSEIADLNTVNSEGWSFPTERIKVLERHIEDIEAHKPGQITEIAHVGLFEKMGLG